MVKRILCILCLALLLPCAAMANEMVIDEANLFSSSEVETMEAIIQRIEEKYQVDVVVLTTYNVQKTSSDRIIQEYADSYIENNNYGMGKDQSAFLYMIDMNNRAPVISTSGVMIDYITDGRREAMLDASYDFLAAGWYGRSGTKILNYLEHFLEEGRVNGSFRYDAETGERLSGLYNALTGTEMLIAAAAGIAAALIMYCSVKGKYNLKGSTYRYDRAGNADCDLTRNEATYLRESVSVRRHSSNTGGGMGSSGGRSISSGRGSSVHRSSSGRSFGGGVGRRF